MSSLWILLLSFVVVSTLAKDVDLNICAFSDEQLNYAKNCLKKNVDQEVIADWESRLSAFGQLTENEIIRMICKENADMGGPILAGTLEDYFGPGEKMQSELVIVNRCLEASVDKGK